MSKSYGNAISLDEDLGSVEQRLGRMATDPRRVRRTDPGDPADCPAFRLHQVYCTPDEIEYVTAGCKTASIGCLDCKKVMIKHVVADLARHRERRAAMAARYGSVGEVLYAGGTRARVEAQATMHDVRAKLGFGGAREV